MTQGTARTFSGSFTDYRRFTKFTASATVTSRVCTAGAHALTWRLSEKLSPRLRREKNSPGVELVDDAFEADDGEEPGAEAG